MASLMMFGALLLGAVMTEVHAQSNSTSTNWATPSSTTFSGSTLIVSSSQLLSHSVPPSSYGAVNNTASIAATPATNMPVPATSTPGTGPTMNVKTTTSIAMNVKTTTSIGMNTWISPTPSSVVMPTSACATDVITFSMQSIDTSKRYYIHKNVNYTFTDTSCSNKESCCGGEGNTTLTLTFANCHLLKVKDYKCGGDIVKVCKCGAGFLSASFFITMVGIFFFLVPN